MTWALCEGSISNRRSLYLYFEIFLLSNKLRSNLQVYFASLAFTCAGPDVISWQFYVHLNQEANQIHNVVKFRGCCRVCTATSPKQLLQWSIHGEVRFDRQNGGVYTAVSNSHGSKKIRPSCQNYWYIISLEIKCNATTHLQYVVFTKVSKIANISSYVCIIHSSFNALSSFQRFAEFAALSFILFN